MTSTPVVTRDPRFRAGRALIERGQCEQAVDVFSTLLEEALRTYGDDNLESAPAYYEYGNALLRAFQQKKSLPDGVNPDKLIESKPSFASASREAAAAAADRRAQGINAHLTEATPFAKQDDNTNSAKKADSIEATRIKNLTRNDNDKSILWEKDGFPESEDTLSNDDAKLALEMMETAWSILDKHTEGVACSERNYGEWVNEQLPRYLTGIGDALSSVYRHADSVDAYCRALEHRQVELEKLLSDGSTDRSLILLRCRRQVVELNTLIAEELLSCPPNEDVTTSESHSTLVTASERIDFARGYYDKARDELQETVFLLGEIAATGKNIVDEKENVCFASTLVMGLGIALADIDEIQGTKTCEEPKKKKARPL